MPSCAKVIGQIPFNSPPTSASHCLVKKKKAARQTALLQPHLLRSKDNFQIELKVSKIKRSLFRLFLLKYKQIEITEVIMKCNYLLAVELQVIKHTVILSFR